MAMIEDHARCWTCGYQLRGLEGTVCPECGRTFDPADPSTFDRRAPGWRRRRTIRRGIVLGVVLLSTGAMYRQGKILKGEATLVCVNCGVKQTVSRWEPQAPKWFGVRLPGVHWRGRIGRTANDTRPDCGKHNLSDVHVRFDYSVGSANTRVISSPSEVPHVGGIDGNGKIVWQKAITPENAGDLLHKLMSPENFGVTVCSPPECLLESTEPTGP